MSHELKHGTHKTKQHQTLAHVKHNTSWVDQIRKLVNLRGYQPETAERIVAFKEKRK